MEEENLLNLDKFEKLKEQPIMYGENVQLFHLQSNKFLSFDLTKVSDLENDNLKVTLSEEYREETCFKIEPCFSYQQDTKGLIFDGDIINIAINIDGYRLMTGEPYLHASLKSKISKKSLKDQDKIYRDLSKTLKEGDRSLKQGEEIKEVNISTDQKSNWR